MLEATKEIVIALIESNQICCHNDTDQNIQDVNKAIKSIYQELQNSRFIEPKQKNS